MSGEDELSLLDDLESPSKAKIRPQSRNANPASSKQPDKTREDTLRQELANVKKVNETIEGLLTSLQKAQSNMKTVNTTVSNTSSLLNTWTRILSQTEHNQRLILDPSWQGASQDIADIEEDAQAKQYAAERQEAEEQERKAAAARKLEEDERRRTEAVSKSSKPTARGRGRVASRGASTTTSTPASAGNTSLLRAPSTSRGRVSSYGRARGTRGKS